LNDPFVPQPPVDRFRTVFHQFIDRLLSVFHRFSGFPKPPGKMNSHAAGAPIEGVANILSWYVAHDRIPAGGA
jgi:hypothetical protein